MGPFKACVLLCISLLMSAQTLASAFTDHGLSISRAMASFYMFGASGGDNKYKKDYEHYLMKAERQLFKMDKRHKVMADRLKPMWADLRPQLVYEYDKYTGYYVPGLGQGRFRQYLNAYYNEYMNSKNTGLSIESRLMNIQIKIEIMLARFFDLASAAFVDEGGLDGNEPIINNKKVTKQISIEIEDILKLSQGKPYLNELKQIQRKWRFIESSVVNSQEKPALLLVYYNKERIMQLLETSKIMMAKN